MEVLQTNQSEFNIFKTLHLIENDEVLNQIFRGDKISLSYPVLFSLAKQGTLSTDILDRAKEFFEHIVLKNETQLNKYIKLGSVVTEVAEVVTKVKKDKTQKLPKRYGKRQVEKDISANGGVKTELDRAMLDLNDIRNLYCRLLARAISDKVLGTKKLSDQHCRDIVAVKRILENKVTPIFKIK